MSKPETPKGYLWTNRQTVAIYATVAVVALMCLFPPWEYRLKRGPYVSGRAPGPYRLIFLGAPDVPSDSAPIVDAQGKIIEEAFFDSYKEESRQFWSTHFDVTRFSLGLVAALVVGAGAIFACRQRGDNGPARASAEVTPLASNRSGSALHGIPSREGPPSGSGVEERHGVRQEEITEQLSYAGFWKRLAAHIIDNIIGTIVVFAVLTVMVFTNVVMRAGGAENQDAVACMGWILAAVLWWLYFAVMESSATQGTFGKMALGIKVTNHKGHRIGFGQATGRHFGKLISAMFFCIGFLMVAFTRQKQGLHDIMAGCLVFNRSRHTNEVQGTGRNANTSEPVGVAATPRVAAPKNIATPTAPAAPLPQTEPEEYEVEPLPMSGGGWRFAYGASLLVLVAGALLVVVMSVVSLSRQPASSWETLRPANVPAEATTYVDTNTGRRVWMHNGRFWNDRGEETQ